MKNIDKFLEVIASEIVCGNIFSENQPQPDKIMDILGKAVNRELLLEIDDKMVEYKTMLATYSVAQGLKVAIEIIDGSYCSER